MAFSPDRGMISHRGICQTMLWSLFLQLGLTAALAAKVQVGGGTEVAAAGHPAHALEACWTSGTAINTSTKWDGSTFQGFMQSKPARLELYSVLWSAKQPCAAPGVTTGSPASCPLTLITTTTDSRLYQLEAQCRSWPGPLVAAMYVMLDVTPGQSVTTEAQQKVLEAAHAAFQELFKRMEETPSACALRGLVVFELLKELAMRLLMPINSLRNVALLAASTPLVAMLDVDLVVSQSLGQQLVTGSERAQKAQQLEQWAQQHVIILPALEPYTQRRAAILLLLQWANKAVAGNKSMLRAMVEDREMCFFQQLSYPRGHKPTNFSRWYAASEAYVVKHQPFYEPWFMVGRKLNPMYDVRFRGYGYNKQNHVATVVSKKMDLMVHPEAWVVHRPHNTTPVHRLYVKALNARSRAARSRKVIPLVDSTQDSSQLTSDQVGTMLHHRVNQIFMANQRSMKTGQYSPVVDEPTLYCQGHLPWWK